MKLHRSIAFNPFLMSIVPLVNVLVLVLAFSLLSNAFIMQPGISVRLPLSSFALGPQRNVQVISITAGAIPVIYFRDRKISAAELDNLLAAGKPDGTSLVVRADRAVPFDLVAQVLNIGLQRGYSVAMAAQSNEVPAPSHQE